MNLFFLQAARIGRLYSSSFPSPVCLLRKQKAVKSEETAFTSITVKKQKIFYKTKRRNAAHFNLLLSLLHLA